jgi:hypothetical protein
MVVIVWLQGGQRRHLTLFPGQYNVWPRWV